MALNKTTRNLLIAGGVLAVGGLAYWYFRRRKKGVHGEVVAVRKPMYGGVRIYVKQGFTNKEITEASEVHAETGDRELYNKKFPKLTDIKIGDKIKITNGDTLNGTYKITDILVVNGNLDDFELENVSWGGFEEVKKPYHLSGSQNWLFWNKGKDAPRWRLIK